MAILGGILFLIGAAGAGLHATGVAASIPGFLSVPMGFTAYLITAAVGAALFLWGRRPSD